MFNRFFDLFSNDIGIDLGTANSLVYVNYFIYRFLGGYNRN